MRRSYIPVFVIAVAVMTAALAKAQGGRGAAPAGRGGVATVERIVVHGKSLEGNLEGDSPDREVTVYLPPSYRTDQARRYPVVYLLHDFGVRDDAFTGRLANLQESADRLAAAAGFSSPIVVTPNAFTLHGGSVYSNSATTGDWERFVAEELVAYIDSHYRTITERISRGLAGHSMGAYGALRIGIKRPDVFSSLYLMSAAFLDAKEHSRPDAAAEAIRTPAQAGVTLSQALALAAAWSPNPNNGPLFLDLPFRDGKTRQDIAAKWELNSGLGMLENAATNLNRYYAIAIDIGKNDPLLASNRPFHEALTRLRISHSYEEYDGDHNNRLGERIDRNLLPFFSKNLASPANPTSPNVKD